jgi:hypothetical protein
MIVLGLIMWSVFRDLSRALRSSGRARKERALVVSLAAALLALAVGNLTQLLLVQAQTASLAWLLVGVTARLDGLVRPEREPC